MACLEAFLLPPGLSRASAYCHRLATSRRRYEARLGLCAPGLLVVRGPSSRGHVLVASGADQTLHLWQYDIPGADLPSPYTTDLGYRASWHIVERRPATLGRPHERGRTAVAPWRGPPRPARPPCAADGRSRSLRGAAFVAIFLLTEKSLAAHS
jgi:hypothetical protein